MFAKIMICPENFLGVLFFRKVPLGTARPPPIFDATYIPVIPADKGSQLWKTYHIVEHSFFPSYCTMKASKYVSVFSVLV
jgi:hypothetical protein